MPGETPQLLAGLQVPQAQSAIAAPRERALSVRGESHALDFVGVSFAAEQLFTALEIPHAQDGVPPAGEGAATVGRKHDTARTNGVSFKGAQRFAGSHIPEPDSFVFRPSGQSTAVVR